MNIMHTMASEARTSQVPKRRFYSLELKLQIVDACTHPGASIAGVALQHGINTNIVHRWIREHSLGTLVVQPQVFIPVTLSMDPEPAPTKPVAVAATPEIRMELRRGTSSVTVMWPSELAGDCGVWLHDGFGMWCAARRLNQGGFEWPRGGATMPTSLTLTKQQFDALVLGLPWSRLEQMQSITRV